MASNLEDYKVPTTLLQAVNICLEAIGQIPVNSLDNPGVDAETALKRLGESSIETQSEAWAWNSDECYIIDPSQSGDIVLPSGTLHVRQAWTSDTYRKRLVVRGGKLYDRAGHTFNIGVAASVDITIALAFEDLPQPARWYITLKGARRMVGSKLNSTTSYQFTKADEDQARLRMEQAEDDAQAMDTMAHTNPHIQTMRRR